MSANGPKPEHDEWHSHTVVLTTDGKLTVVGRWEAVVDGQVQLLGVALHELGATEESRDDWVARLKKFGIPIEHKTWSLPRDAVTAIVPLRDA